MAPFAGDFASSTYVAVLVVGRDGVIRHHTSGGGRMLASPDEDLVGRGLLSLFRPELSGQLQGLLRRVEGGGARPQALGESTCTLIHRGSLIRMTAVTIAEDPDLAVIVLCQFVDRAMVREAFEEGRRASRYDALTGVSNRRVFDERCRAFFGSGGVRPAILASWDIDDLKAVNDFHGHRIGDQVVRRVAERLSTVLGATGVLARVGGDEFAALLIQINAADAKLLLEAAARAVRRPIEGTDVAVTVTCGAAVSMSAEDWPRPWARADEALFMARRRGRGGIGFVEQE